jgi:hypothetical protein
MRLYVKSGCDLRSEAAKIHFFRVYSMRLLPLEEEKETREALC